MFTKFKSAIYNVVGNFEPTERGTVNNFGTLSLRSENQSSITQSVNGKEKALKYPYTRPHFLQFNSEDEISVTGDHVLRPIICPRDISKMPWNAGYAETVNAGKSKKNEDQAAVHVGVLTRTVKMSPQNKVWRVGQNSSSNKTQPRMAKRESSFRNNFTQNKKLLLSDNETDTKVVSTSDTSDENLQKDSLSKDQSSLNSTEEYDRQALVSLPYYYFGVFDGHAGWGAAVAAATQLHQIIYEKLCDVVELIIPDGKSDSNLNGPLWSNEKQVSPESAVVGALERAFWAMDQQIGEDRYKHQLLGGCTACVSLFIFGKLFVANAGDSRGTIALASSPVSMSFDFTPETETQRVRKLGARHPELLGGEFTHLEFQRRPLKSDLGKKAPYRDHYMKGWALKTITENDLKYPLVCGEGKRSRVLATIGVTRGFGDHDLRAQFSGLPIKPFLSPEPEVRVFDVMNAELTDTDVLILGTDGLWDILSNEKAVEVVCSSLEQFPSNDSHRYKYRYTSAAHDLVLCSRGRMKEHSWRTTDDRHATIDDISVFVIPLRPYQTEFEQWLEEVNVCESQSELARPGCFLKIKESTPELEQAEEATMECSDFDQKHFVLQNGADTLHSPLSLHQNSGSSYSETSPFESNQNSGDPQVLLSKPNQDSGGLQELSEPVQDSGILQGPLSSCESIPENLFLTPFDEDSEVQLDNKVEPTNICDQNYFDATQ